MSYRGYIAKHLAKYQPYNVISGNWGAWSHQDSLTALMVCPCCPCSFCPGTICPCCPWMAAPSHLLWQWEWQHGQCFHTWKDPDHRSCLILCSAARIQSHHSPKKQESANILSKLAFLAVTTHTTLHHAKRPNFHFACVCICLCQAGLTAGFCPEYATASLAVLKLLGAHPARSYV